MFLEYYKYIQQAEEVAKKSTCGIIDVGCVIVKDGQVVSTGANATIRGYKPCREAGHVLTEEGRCMRQLHAEVNALLNAEKRDLLVGATAYVTLEPCDNCTKMLNHLGIKKVVFKKKFPNPYNSFFIDPMEWVCLEDLKGDNDSETQKSKQV